ncbi:NADP-dependent oxidoreductase [Shimazuella kribbensis]|uniref:NADP-dependent oxidoreductase n=1 Tax=Shimazuella kribbensis TaxID=139808 RepID=UPI00040D73F2|nr:NADP-dependent oxidoreductase [Shimazuella kribbensis]
MRVAAIKHYGTPEEIMIMDVPIPEPKKGEVLLRVHAAAVNPVDLVTREGTLIPDDEEELKNRPFAIEPAIFPMVLGWDAAGIIEAVGEGVSNWAVGDRVIAFSQQIVNHVGTYAEYICLSEEVIAHAPKKIGLSAAATIPLAGLTAYQAIEWLNLKPGETLLVNAPLGAVGGFAVQLAHHNGIKVVGIGTKVEREFAYSLGVDRMIDREGDIVAQIYEQFPDGLDGALDVLGGEMARYTFASLRNGGRYTSTVPSFQREGVSSVDQKDVVSHAVWVQPNSDHLTELSRLAELGKLQLRVAEAYPLEHAHKAHHAFSKDRLRGKIILIP